MAKLGQESQLYPGLQVSMAQEAPVQTQANQLYPGLQVSAETLTQQTQNIV